MLNRAGKIAIIFFLILLLVSGCGTGKKDLTKDKTGRQILEAAYEKSAKVENFDMKILMSMKMNPGDGQLIEMDMEGTATLFQNPLMMKTDLTIVAEGQKMEMQQFMEESPVGLVIYQNHEGQWYKMVIDDPLLVEMNNLDPSNNINLFLDHLISAEILSEERLGVQETVKIQMVASSQMYEDMMDQLPTGDIVTSQLPLDSGILSKMGDIKGMVWVDKNTLDIVKTSMDLTDNLQNLGRALKEKGFPPEALVMFETMEMYIEYEIFNINQAHMFSIPEEARSGVEVLTQ